MKRITILLCVFAMLFTACAAQPVDATTATMTITVSTATETVITEITTTEAVATMNAAPTTTKKPTTTTQTQTQSTSSSTTVAMPETVLLPFNDGGTLLWNASDISNAYVEYTQEYTENHSFFAELSGKNTQTFVALLNRMRKTLVETKVQGMGDFS